MHSCTLILITCGIIAVLMTCSSASVIPPQPCSASVLMTADAKYRQICSLLSQFAREFEYPIDDRVIPDMSEQLIDNGIKRKDVDHVFLRFGRPRM